MKEEKAKAEAEVSELREKEELSELERDGYDPAAYGPAYDIPRYELEDDEECWHGWMPPAEKGGDPVYIEGIFPDTVLTRRAMEAVPKKVRRDPLIGLKEAQENLLRICIRQIGDQTVNFAQLRGKGLDRFLDQKQMHYVTAYFDQLTTPEEVDVDDFLSTVKKGRRK